MIAANQFYGDNLERDYPFQAGGPLPFRVFVDAVFRITLASEILSSEAYSINLVSLTAGAGTTTIFEVVGGPLDGYYFKGVIPASPSLYERVRLDFYNTSNVLQPGQGYGYLVCGDATIPTGAYAAPVEASTVRYLEVGTAVSFRLANAPCSGDTAIHEALGAAAGLSFQGRTTAVVSRCVEIALTSVPAPALQGSMTPDTQGTAVTPVAIPLPTETVTTYETAGTTAITTHGIVVSDALPANPGYAASPAGTAALGAEVVAGHNIRLTGSVRDGVLRVNYALGAGAGAWCSAVPGCSPGVPATSALKSINGVHGEAINFVRGAAIDILPSPGDHILYFVVHPEKLSRATS